MITVDTIPYKIVTTAMMITILKRKYNSVKIETPINANIIAAIKKTTADCL